MTTSTSPEHVPTPEHVAPKHIVLEKLASELIDPKQTIPNPCLSPAIQLPETISEPNFMITFDVPDVEIEQSY
jgi:hypothetical protein